MPDFMATNPAATSTRSRPTAPTIAGLLLAVLPVPNVLIAGGAPAGDGVCAWSDMPLSPVYQPIRLDGLSTRLGVNSFSVKCHKARHCNVTPSTVWRRVRTVPTGNTAGVGGTC